jgi:non-ribosomal peptide synthetase component E (peptide arylation enzyme)
VNEFEVEEKMLRHPDVVSIAAVAVPSELGGGTEEEVKAVASRLGTVHFRGAFLTSFGILPILSEALDKA